jgi:CheY-like chemotaxis protein
MATILIIDDDLDILTVLRMTLGHAGYAVMEARNGTEGIAALRQHQPDLIILDVMMDTPTEGFELAKSLHSQDPSSEFAAYRDTPILMLTAVQSKTPLLGEPSIDFLPVELFVDKPIDPIDLVSKIQWMLAREKA